MIRTPDLKERFLALYNSIDREGAGDLLAWLESSDFFTAPASTRFHGAHASGLLEHSLNVCDCLLKQLETCGVSGNYEPDTIAVVALLHDLCKVNFAGRAFATSKTSSVSGSARRFLRSMRSSHAVITPRPSVY